MIRNATAITTNGRKKPEYPLSCDTSDRLNNTQSLVASTMKINPALIVVTHDRLSASVANPWLRT